MKWISIAAIALGCVLCSASTARAQAKHPILDYGKGSLIIPMDVCHQYQNRNSKPQYRMAPICYCPTGSRYGDDGIVKAYGLIYRLLENGIIIAFVIDDQKAGIDANDMYVYHATEPARLFDRSTGGTTKFYKTFCDSPLVNGNRFINYWGAPFVIPAAGGNALRAMQLIKDGSPGVNGRGKFDASTFSTVDVHVAQADFKAPTYRKSKAPPRPLALLDLGSGGGGGSSGAGVNILINYLNLAGINKAGTAGTACSPGTIYGIFNRDTQFTRDDCLRKGDYFTLWAPHWTPQGEDYEGVIRKIGEFTDAGGGFFAECAAIATLEGSVLETRTSQCNYCRFYWSFYNPFYNDQVGSLAGHFMMTNGIIRNGLNTSYASSAQTSTDGFIYRDVGSPFVQKGALSMKNTSGSHTHDWMPAACPGCFNRYVFVGGIRGPSRYKAGVVRLVSSCSDTDYNASARKCRRAANDPVSAYRSYKSNWDYFTFRFKDNDPQKGPIFYLGGHSYSGTTPAGVRLVLNTLLNLEALVIDAVDPSTPREVVRSGPMVLPLETTSGPVTHFIQGTKIVYEGTDEVVTTYSSAADKDTFIFPHRKGHLRAFNSDLMTSNDPTDYASLGTPLWDVASLVPTPTPTACSTLGQCRTLFTHTGTGSGSSIVQSNFDLNNINRFGRYLGVTSSADKAELVKLIHQGRRDTFNNRVAAIGGIDVSTMAIIPPSPQAGLSTRPTMIYVGGLDGMIHAFCATAVSPCDKPGRELWAYIPRTQLPLLRLNTQSIQGSPIVTDVFGDFDGNGLREWKTIMVITTGSGDPLDSNTAPAIIALDVTDPTKPKVIWEVTTPASRTANELGLSLRVALGPVLVGGTLKTAAFVVSNNGGTGGAGIYVNAYSMDDGKPIWTRPFVHDYPNPRKPGNRSVPKTGIPGGLAIVDIDERGSITHVLVPSLYGELFSLDATDGTNRNSGALFSFSQDFHPIGYAPTIFRQSATSPFFALVQSSDYLDDVNAVWLKSGDTHYAVAVKIDASTTPISEIGGATADRPFTIDLGLQHAGAQAIVAGDEILIVTSDQDINSLQFGQGSGTLIRYDISSGRTQRYTLQTAGSASVNVDVARGQVFVAGADKSVKLDVSTDFDAAGHTTEIRFKAKVGRKLWLLVE